MKIVLRDLYNQLADELICENVSPKEGADIVRILNDLNRKKPYKNSYYQLVSDEYELKGGK